MKGIFKLFLYLALVVPSYLYGQNSSNKGTDFWIGFPAHGDGNKADMYLYITSDSSTTGTVSIPGQSWSSNFTVTANQMTLVAIPANNAYVGCSDCIEDKGIHVVSNKKIVVYSHIYYQYRSDATLVLPTPTTGKEYYAMAYEQIGPNNDRSQFMIVANQDDTKVNITPTVALGGSHAAGTTYQITLDAGEVYQGRASSSTADITGTHIQVIDTGSTANCRTVAVFSGSSNCFIGCSPNGGIASRDNLYQQLYPTKSWGNRYVTIPFKGRTADNIRILAKEDNTQIVVNKPSGAPTVAYIDAGEFYPFTDVTQSYYIIASKPVCVAQYQESQKCGGKGDPSMTILNPIEQTLKEITVYSSQYEDIDDHYINVIIPNSGVSSFRIDGSSVSFTKVPKLQSYSYAQITVTKGNHQLKSDVGFIAIAYGFGDYESYGYAAGANIKDLSAKLELVNSAQNDIPSICLGDTAEFEGQAPYSVSLWEWDYGDGSKRDTAQFTEHEFPDTGSYTVTLFTHKVNFDGCSSYDSSTIDIRVNSKPVADFTTSLRCEANTISFTDASTVPSPEVILSRQWIFHNGNPVYQTNTSKYYDTAGTYPVRLITKTENQCSDEKKIDMVVNPNPVPSMDIDTLCFKDSAYFINTSTVKTGAVATNKWYFGDGDSSTDYNPVHMYTKKGWYYVTLEATTDSACVATTMDSVYKHPEFKLLFTHNDTCAGLDVNFTNYSYTLGGSLGNYRWKFPDGSEYTTTNATHQFGTPGSYQVKLLGTQNNYCTDSVEQTVVVDPLVSASFTSTGICLNDTVTFINTSTVASGTIPTVKWNLDDGFSRTGDTIKLKYSSSGTKDIQLIVGSDQGCADTLDEQITLYNPRITGFNFPLVCKGTSAKISGIYNLDTDTIQTYDWDVEGFSSDKDTLVYINMTPGKYTVDHTITTKYGCTLTRIDSFDVNDVPVANFTVSNVCDGYNLTPSNLSTIGNGESITKNDWYFKGTQAATSQNPNIVGTPSGSGTLRLVVTSAAGCKDEISKNVDIYPVPNANFNIANVCLGESTVFTSSSNVSTGFISSENWTYNDGVTDAGTVVSRVYPADGSYSVKLVVISDQGCPDSLSQNFNINPRPQLAITPDKTTGCEPMRVNFTNNSTINSGSIATYDWDFGDGNTGTGLVNSHDYLTTGNYTITIYGESNFGCRDTLVVAPSINVLPTPVAGFSYDPPEPSLLFPDVNFYNESTPDATSFLWTTGDGSSYTTENPFHTYPEAGDYIVTLIATADNGCADTMVQPLNVKLDFFIWIPTVFSPNGDNTNDVFRVHGIFSEVQGYEIQIFNRWGEVVFQSTNTSEIWDGTYNDTECPAGSYGYRVRYINYETGRWDGRMGSIKIIR
ncbi:MAG: PKD domain-containing protein [Bacteroidetes bacterium]|nr:PKD domain-containing protein [Bacteroidota bacterium]